MLTQTMYYSFICDRRQEFSQSGPIQRTLKRKREGAGRAGVTLPPCHLAAFSLLTTLHSHMHINRWIQ